MGQACDCSLLGKWTETILSQSCFFIKSKQYVLVQTHDVLVIVAQVFLHRNFNDAIKINHFYLKYVVNVCVCKNVGEMVYYSPDVV